MAMTNGNNAKYTAPPAYVVENDNSEGYNLINGVKHQHRNDYAVWIGDKCQALFAFENAAHAFAQILNANDFRRFSCYHRSCGKLTQIS